MAEKGSAERHEEYMTRYLGALPSLRAYVLSVVRDFHLMEDILQDVAIAAWRQYEGYDTSRPFVAWVLGMARHKCTDFMRARKVKPLLPEDVVRQLAEEASAFSEEAMERRKVLADCADKLTPSAQGILRLRLEEGLGADEIARRMGKSWSAVRKVLSRARAFLARCTERQLSPERS